MAKPPALRRKWEDKPGEKVSGFRFQVTGYRLQETGNREQEKLFISPSKDLRTVNGPLSTNH
jgi:hypothetical protein